MRTIGHEELKQKLDRKDHFRLLPATSTYREEVHRRSAAARAHLDAATFEAGWAAGQTMTEEQAINFALQDAYLRR
jgi:hypothetical protein